MNPNREKNDKVIYLSFPEDVYIHTRRTKKLLRVDDIACVTIVVAVAFVR